MIAPTDNTLEEEQRLLAVPPWMPRVLAAAAIYNIVWGVFAILFPGAIFRWAGFDPVPAYPELWQCIGMIVGVYGVGYGIAAMNPVRHWPIVFVGLLGKIFGPLGFAWSVGNGRFPAAMGWTILTNDLIWWIPFCMIIWRAIQVEQAAGLNLRISLPSQPIDPVGRMISQLGSTLSELSRDTPLLVVFLRHSGCTFCREALADIAVARSRIEEQGTQIALVHMGTTEPTELLEQNQLTDVHCFRDPNCALYRTFGLRIGRFLDLFGPLVWWRGLQAGIGGGHGIGSLNGNGFRMPGVFLLQDEKIVRAYRHKSAADRPDYVELATPPARQNGSANVTLSEPMAVGH